MSEDTCSICGVDLVLPHGKMDKRLAIIVSEPHKDDLSNGLVLSGAYGTILRNELARVKLDLKQFYKTSLWQHEPNKNSLCYKMGVENLKKLQDKFDVILVVGADAVIEITGNSVSKIGGLATKNAKTIEFFGDKTTVVPCISIGVAFKAVGEIRFALQALSDAIEGKS